MRPAPRPFLFIALTLLAVSGTEVLAQRQDGRSARAKDPLGVMAPEDNPTTEAKAALGRELFENPLLSGNRQISCATCHDPTLSFAESRAESKGVFEIDVGRNSPSLLAVAHYPGFQGPMQPSKQGRGPSTGAKMLSLEERCLGPIENPIEMGSTIAEAISVLKLTPGMTEKFDQAFGLRGSGVTSDRLGKALAAFVRTLRPADSPYRRYLEGDKEALDDQERQGLQIFTGMGRCVACHSGPALSDGLFHDVVGSQSHRTRQQLETAARHRNEIQDAVRSYTQSRKAKTEKAKTASFLPAELPFERAIQSTGPQSRSSYVPVATTPGSQTLALWDVQRTAPYFRDGSVSDLETAVRQHIQEMREAANEILAIEAANSQMAGCAFGIQTVVARPDIPTTLKPKLEKGGEPLPGKLGPHEISDLVAFLRALSPR